MNFILSNGKRKNDKIITVLKSSIKNLDRKNKKIIFGGDDDDNIKDIMYNINYINEIRSCITKLGFFANINEIIRLFGEQFLKPDLYSSINDVNIELKKINYNDITNILNKLYRNIQNYSISFKECLEENRLLGINDWLDLDEDKVKGIYDTIKKSEKMDEKINKASESFVNYYESATNNKKKIKELIGEFSEYLSAEKISVDDGIKNFSDSLKNVLGIIEKKLDTLSKEEKKEEEKEEENLIMLQYKFKNDIFYSDTVLLVNNLLIDILKIKINNDYCITTDGPEVDDDNTIKKKIDDYYKYRIKNSNENYDLLQNLGKKNQKRIEKRDEFNNNIKELGKFNSYIKEFNEELANKLFDKKQINDIISEINNYLENYNVILRKLKEDSENYNNIIQFGDNEINEATLNIEKLNTKLSFFRSNLSLLKTSIPGDITLKKEIPVEKIPNIDDLLDKNKTNLGVLISINDDLNTKLKNKNFENIEYTEQINEINNNAQELLNLIAKKNIKLNDENINTISNIYEQISIYEVNLVKIENTKKILSLKNFSFGKRK